MFDLAKKWKVLKWEIDKTIILGENLNTLFSITNEADILSMYMSTHTFYVCGHDVDIV